MRVGPNGDGRAECLGAPENAPVEVEPLRIRVQLDGNAERDGLFQDDIDVDRLGVTGQQQPARRVSEDREMRIVERA